MFWVVPDQSCRKMIVIWKQMLSCVSVPHSRKMKNAASLLSDSTSQLWETVQTQNGVALPTTGTALVIRHSSTKTPSSSVIAAVRRRARPVPSAPSCLRTYKHHPFPNCCLYQVLGLRLTSEPQLADRRFLAKTGIVRSDLCYQ